MLRTLALCLLLPFAVQADDALWALLKKGGQVVLIRHGLTDPGVGDPPGFKLEDCATQRNLSATGRDEAKRVGEAFRARGIAIAKVLSSPWCRCVETAKIAFGESRPEVALSNLFGRPENREKQLAQFRKLVAAAPKTGNLVLVTHGSTTAAFTGVAPGTGELVVVTPEGGGRYRTSGRITLATNAPARS